MKPLALLLPLALAGCTSPDPLAGPLSCADAFGQRNRLAREEGALLSAAVRGEAIDEVRVAQIRARRRALLVCD